MKAKKLTLRDTDALVEYTEAHPEVIHIQTYEMLNHLWKKNKKISMVDLFIVTLTDEEEIEEVGCGCCDQCNGQEGCECCQDCNCSSEVQEVEQSNPENDVKVMNISDFINSIANQ